MCYVVFGELCLVFSGVVFLFKGVFRPNTIDAITIA